MFYLSFHTVDAMLSIQELVKTLHKSYIKELACAWRVLGHTEHQIAVFSTL